ncbi:RNA-directed DNA polymerase, eukaryota, reverse transcriptase zinc-binding domain protein [Tanacetum coccineum]
MVVSLNQSAFIPGRHIEDNILISQELFKGYNRKQGAKRCAMKIDIQKAYDTINWEFIKDCLILVGFHEVMVGWIMTCITSTSFSLCVNGEVCGYFKGGRGLRQGDPISLYIFTLVMEVLNMIMIKEIRESGKFKYHSGCKELKLTHMCFADDLLILCNGDKESLGVVKKALHEFSSVSELLPNLNKSTIFFESINEGLKRELLQILPFKLGSLPMKYLGVPLIAKKLGVKDLMNDLDKLFKRFLWNSGDSAKGKARVVWNLVNTDKLKGKSFWEVEPDVSDSWGWKSMLELRNKMKPFVTYKIGNGNKISLWHDKWCNIGPISNIIPKRLMFEARFKGNETVKDGIANGRWDWLEEWELSYPILKQITFPQLTNNEDKVLWLSTENKEVEYSTKIAWLSLKETGLKLNGNSSRSYKELIRYIEGNVSDMLQSLTVKNSPNVSMVAKKWGLRWESDKLVPRALNLGSKNLSTCFNPADLMDDAVSLVSDLNENMSFTLVLVMPSTRASMLIGWVPMGLGRVFVEENVTRARGFSMVA